jgi:PAS domain S-box-containing protein
MNKVKEVLERKIIELKTFVNNIPDMAWLKDKDSRFIIANQAFGDAVGMDPEKLVGETCAVCFGEEDAAKHRQDDLRVMEGKKQQVIEEKILDKDKNDVWLETIKSPIIDEEGEVIGTVGIARNITDRKKADEELKRRTEELERMNRLMVGRELKMTEMKKEIEELKKKVK